MSNLNESDIAKITAKSDKISPVTTLAIIINKKHDKTKELTKAIANEAEQQVNYLHKYNDKLLNTNFKEATGESRPTVAMKEAYIQEELKEDYDNLKQAETRTKIIRRDIELLNDRIRLEEYIIKLELKS